jgi:hypothetical protein
VGLSNYVSPEFYSARSLSTPVAPSARLSPSKALLIYIRGLFEKFVDSLYYSESELCGGAVTGSFSKYSLGKRCASYNASPTSRKCAADS